MLSGKTKSEWRIDREIFHFDLNLIVICPDFYKKNTVYKKKSTMPEQLYIYFLVDQNYYSARIRRRGR